MLVNLDRHLKHWQSAGIIGSDVVDKIRDFESKRDRCSWVVFGISAIGAVSLAMGVISIVAANWEFLAHSVKLTAYFALQGIVGYLFLRSENIPGAGREAMLMLFSFLFLAGIALVGQVYNLSGPWWQTIAFWLMLSLPSACLARAHLLPTLWSVASLLAVCAWHEEARAVPDTARLSVALAAPYVLMSASLGAAAVGVLTPQFRNSLLVVGAVALLLPAAILADMSWSISVSWNFKELPDMDKIFLMIPWLGALAACALSFSRKSVPLVLRATTGALMLVMAAYLTLPRLLAPTPLVGSLLGEVLGALGFMAAWSLAAAAAAMASRRHLFNVASFVLAVRVVVVYFQAVGSLTTTGIGLVVTGLFILSVAMLWSRARRSLRSRLMGAV